LDEEGFCKDGFALKIVPNMERRGKNKPSQCSECYMKVMNKS
jgi:hypothetical protein